MAHSKETKKELIENLRKSPIIQIACEKSSIGRATFYRWYKADPKFASLADAAIDEGLHLVNDMCEAQILAAIRDQNMTAIMFWLRARHPAFKAKVELSAEPKDELTQQEAESIRKALILSGLIKEPDNGNTGTNPKPKK